MHKPNQNGNMKPLVVHDDMLTEHTISEISCSKEDGPINQPKILAESTKGFMSNEKRRCSDVESDQMPTSSPKTNPGTYTTNSIVSTTAGKGSHTLSKAKASPLSYVTASTAVTKPETVDRRSRTKKYTLNSKSRKSALFQSPEHCRFCLNMNVLRITYQNLFSKYEATTQNTYNLNVINDLMLDSRTHVTAIFKDYLIYDDSAEFIKSCYKRSEASAKLRQVTAYYEKSTMVFPNYIALEEKKYLFKNIERKQKAINAKQNPAAKSDPKHSKEKSLIITKGLFAGEEKKPLPAQTLTKMGIADLVEKFIDRDSLSMINQSNCTNIEAPFAVAVPTEGKKKEEKEEGKKQEKQEKAKETHTSGKKPLVVSVKSKVVQAPGLVASKRKDPVPSAASRSKLQHNQSQEVVNRKKPETTVKARGTASANPTPHAEVPSGRMSAVGYYRASQAKELAKPAPTNLLQANPGPKYGSVPRPATACKASTARNAGQTKTTVEMHINVNLNLNIVNPRPAPKARSGTPQTSAGGDFGRLKAQPQRTKQSPGNVTSRAAAAQAKNTVQGKITTSAATGSNKPAGNILASGKMVKRPQSHADTRTVAVPSAPVSATAATKKLVVPAEVRPESIRKKINGFFSPTAATARPMSPAAGEAPKKAPAKKPAKPPSIQADSVKPAKPSHHVHQASHGIPIKRQPLQV